MEKIRSVAIGFSWLFVIGFFCLISWHLTFAQSPIPGRTKLIKVAGGYKSVNTNDLVVAKNGSTYFTDLSSGNKSNQKSQSVNGVYRLTASGKIQALITNLRKPNGLAFSPDERFLYVNDSQTNDVWVYSVRSDGSLNGGKIFAKLRDPVAKFGSADGLKVDSDGNVFTTGPGGVWIFSSEGELLDRITVPEYASNLAWGGKNLKTLYITATHNIYSIHVKYKGIH